jgi:hypothetical protein
MESSSLIIGGCLEILEQERPQGIRAGKIGGHNAKQPPAPLTTLGFITGGLFH